MSLVIDGSAGISSIDGDAATPASRGADTNTGIFYGTDVVSISTGGIERAQVDASGNFGLGVTPSAWGSFGKAFETSAGGFYGFANASINISANSYYNGTNWIYKTNSAAAYCRVMNGAFDWSIAPSGTAGNAITFTPAMGLDTSGNLLVGTTNALLNARLSWRGTSSASAGAVQVGADGLYGLGCINTAGSTVGGIVVNTSSTAYNTSSDYRLKENVQPMQNALATITQLNPVTYTWKSSGKDSQGFIAHELQAVVPDCVTGEKDATDKDGNPVYQGIDTSFLVATLTKAIQELKAELDSAKERIAVLENK